MIVSWYSRPCEELRVEYLDLAGLSLFPLLDMAYRAWPGENFLAEVAFMDGWIAKLKPNPADIVILDMKTETHRKASGLSFAERVTMIDILMCRETGKPIFRHCMQIGQRPFYELILPDGDRVYGIRQVADTAPVGADARRPVEA